MPIRYNVKIHIADKQEQTHFTCSHSLLGTLLCIMHNVMYIMQHAALYLAHRTTASVSADSNALTHSALIKYEQSSAVEKWLYNPQSCAHTHLDRALCPWSPAPSAGCQTTTRPTWWWISRRAQPQERSTLSETLHLKEIQICDFLKLLRHLCYFTVAITEERLTDIRQQPLPKP